MKESSVKIALVIKGIIYIKSSRTSLSSPLLLYFSSNFSINVNELHKFESGR
uniref:Uncharacterized protein n=1 Tax=Lepeophtheirus salmonis TaxID=72036 RepID=A0A0K2VIT7_LEPSM